MKSSVLVALAAGAAAAASLVAGVPCAGDLSAARSGLSARVRHVGSDGGRPVDQRLHLPRLEEVQARVIVPAVALVAAALAAPAAPATTVIDRTVACEVGLSGGLPKVAVWGYSAIRSWPQPHEASVELRTQIVPAWRLAWISESWLMLSPACTRTRARVPLNARGRGGWT